MLDSKDQEHLPNRVAEVIPRQGVLHLHKVGVHTQHPHREVILPHHIAAVADHLGGVEVQADHLAEAEVTASAAEVVDKFI